MAAGEITINGSPLGLSAASTSKVTTGDGNRLEFSGFAAAEYGVNGAALTRAALTRGEIFNFAHWFSYDDADQIEAMQFVAAIRETSKSGDYHVLLTDERCKVPDTDPPTHAYVLGSVEVVTPGIATKTHRIYKAIFRNGPPLIDGHSPSMKKLIFEMQIGDPFFAAEQLPGPDLVIQNIQTLAENSVGPVVVAEFY